MFKKSILALLVVLTLAFSLIGCEKCEHRDADDDYNCDECGEHFDDGDEQNQGGNGGEGNTESKPKVTFTVRLDNGSTVAGVKFTLTRNNESVDLVSGADGTVVAELDLGLYAVSYDYDSLPEFCWPDTVGVKIEERTDSVTIDIVDNRPDGTAKKPYFISENETEITVPAGGEVFYNIRVASTRYIRVHHDGAVINYNGESYAAKDGVAELVIHHDSSDVANGLFSVKNTTDSEFTVILEVAAALGSIENPIELDGSISSVTVSPEILIYYSWTADKDGFLVLTSPTERNSISISTVLPGDLVVSSQTSGGPAAYLPVNKGDKVTLGFSLMSPTDEELKEDSSLATKALDVEFALNVYAGTADDPVPVLKDVIDISLYAGQSVVLSSETGKLVTVNDTDPISLAQGGNTVTNENGAIVTTLTEPIFTLINGSDHLNGIIIEITDKAE